jgi:hypothetical protein
MRNKQKYITPLLVVLAAAAIATAPNAAAAPSGPAHAQQSCTSLSSSQTDCQSPGNVQVYVAPPQVDYYTYRGGAT